MQLKLKYFLLVVLALSCLEALCQKKKKHALPTRSVIAKYEGGTRNVIVLTLYSDSTFFYQEVGNMMGLKSTKTGAYVLNDSSIALYTWRTYEYLRDLKDNSRSAIFRCTPDRILMYSREQEYSSDSSFYRASFTLSRTQ